MLRTWGLDDETIEALVRGDEVDPQFEPLALFARSVRALGDGPPPTPSPALRALIESGGRSDGLGTTTRVLAARATSRTRGRRAGMGLAAKLGLGTAVAAGSMAGAAAAGVLPDQAQNPVRAAIEAVTPVEFDAPADDGPANFGERVSNDATGQGDGDPGVDGDTISDEAPGAAHRPTDTGPDRVGAGNPGLDRASETPAAPELPDDVPASQGTAPNGSSDPTTPSPPSAVPTTVPDSGGAPGDQQPPDAPPGPQDQPG
jgi:hypothetical protein